MIIQFGRNTTSLFIFEFCEMDFRHGCRWFQVIDVLGKSLKLED